MNRIDILHRKQQDAARRRDYWRMVSQMPDCSGGVKLLAQRMEERLETYCQLLLDVKRILADKIKKGESVWEI